MHLEEELDPIKSFKNVNRPKKVPIFRTNGDLAFLKVFSADPIYYQQGKALVKPTLCSIVDSQSSIYSFPPTLEVRSFADRRFMEGARKFSKILTILFFLGKFFPLFYIKS